MTPAKKKTAKKPATKDKAPPQEIVVVTSGPANVTTIQAPTAKPTGLRRGTAVRALFKIALGTVGFVVYLTTDKEHLKDHVFLGVSVAFIAWGFHELSRQSLKNFLSDIGRFLPWGKKDATAEQQIPPGGV
jgi:hypothetical protein